MAIPTKDAEWASSDITQTTADGNIDNKQEPTEEWKDSGSLYQQNLPYPLLNYQFNLIDEWLRNLNERSYGTVGDIYTTTDTPTVGDLATRFGGTWTARGTQNIGTIVGASVYERTA